MRAQSPIHSCGHVKMRSACKSAKICCAYTLLIISVIASLCLFECIAQQLPPLPTALVRDVVEQPHISEQPSISHPKLTKDRVPQVPATIALNELENDDYLEKRSVAPAAKRLHHGHGASCWWLPFGDVVIHFASASFSQPADRAPPRSI